MQTAKEWLAPSEHKERDEYLFLHFWLFPATTTALPIAGQSNLALN
jgi:hypothetical protein